MAAPVLNVSARLMCSHGGQVVLIPKQTSVLVAGAPALSAGDLVGSPIVGCGLVPSPTTTPCTNVVSEIAIPGVGQSMGAVCAGRPLLLEGVQGITNSIPPGTLIVASPGQAKVMA
jgi:hypothetical protein